MHPWQAPSIELLILLAPPSEWNVELNCWEAIDSRFVLVCSHRALYFYKCLNYMYDEVFQLRERILNEPDMNRKLKVFSLPYVSMIPPLDFFFDRDVQFLLGFHTLFYYLSPLNDDLNKSYEDEFETFEQWFSCVVKNWTLWMSFMYR